MIEIARIDTNKKRFMDLLLLADEQEDMIDRYLEVGEMYALYDGELRTICVVVRVDETTCELKNIATYSESQGKSYGKRLIEYLFVNYRDTCKTFLVGTGDVPGILSFYRKCGFEISHRIPNFFIDNYREPIYEEGIQLKDMVYLKKEI